jgi:hypothetical protein
LYAAFCEIMPTADYEAAWHEAPEVLCRGKYSVPHPPVVCLAVPGRGLIFEWVARPLLVTSREALWTGEPDR